MNTDASVLAKVSGVSARGRLWLARASWLLVAAAAIAFFVAGMPLLVSDLQEPYRTNFGLALQRNGAGELVTIPWIGEQAARAGVMERDVLVAVEGERVTAGPDPTVAEVIPRGAPGTPVTLEVQTGDRPPRTVTLIRGGEEGRALARLGLPVSAVTALSVTLELLVAGGFVGVAGFLFWKRGEERMVWLSSLMLIMVFVGTISLPVRALYLAELTWQYWLDAWISLALGGLLLFLLLFPGGTFAPRWSVAVMVAWLAWAVAAWFIPELYFWRTGPGPLLGGTVTSLGIGVAAQLWRYRTVSNARQRQQTKWVVWGTGGAVMAILVQLAAAELLPATALLFDLLLAPLTRLGQLLIPVTLVFAIFQRRLWEIDLIFNRTLVYSGLSLAIVAVYVVTVGALGTLFQTQGSVLLGLLATGLIAALFQPVRQRLQDGVNRLMFGERDDPYAVLSELTHRLQETAIPGQTLPAITATICQTLKLPYAAIIVQTADGGRSTIAASGQKPVSGHKDRSVQGNAPVPEGTAAEWPLRYQGQVIGWLAVAPRSPGEAFTAREQRLLQDIASQAGAAAYAARLTTALQRSRERLVLTREEERRRIRRDLHDGLGPALASQTFALDAALDLLESDPQGAADLLRGLKTQNQGLVADIRRLVYELRPPTLDELGLAEALAAHVQQLNGRHETEIRLEIRPETVAGLPAAVEVAVYRLVQEGVNNVLRHAKATVCTVAIESDSGKLTLTIADDGRGMPAQVEAGVGLSSMRERAEELGGTFTIGPVEPQGTVIRAALPVGSPFERIVPARPEDVPVVMAIVGEAAAWLEAKGIEQWPSPPNEHWRRRIATHVERGEVYLAYRDGGAVGTLRLTWDDPYWPDDGKAGYVHRLALQDQAHGQGLGRALLNWAGEQIRQRRRSRLRLDVPLENERLRRYYEGQGFSYRGEVRDDDYVGALYEKRV